MPMVNKDFIAPIMQKALANYGIKMVCHFDRLHFYTDTRTHKDKLGALIALNEKNTCKFKALSHHKHLDKKVEIFQPSYETLRSLKELVTGDYAINYIEFAIDFLVPDKKTLRQLQHFFDKHLFFNRKPKSAIESEFHFKLAGKAGSVCKCKKTCICQTRYFTPADDKVRLVMYSDKPTKTDNTTDSVHIEKRFAGIKELKELGLYTFSNIIDINLEQFWSHHLDLRTPNLTALGKLNRFKRDTGRVASNKRGKKEWSSITCLQSYLRNNSHSASAFKRICTEPALKKALKTVFES
jgi:hypothetical protein